jgi:hypothetical protein
MRCGDGKQGSGFGGNVIPTERSEESGMTMVSAR